jgi:nucleoid-associated protein YgaU
MTSTLITPATSSNGQAASAPRAASPATAAGTSGGAAAGQGTMSLTKAALINVDAEGPPQPIECMFNPKEYTFSKANSWGVADTKGTDVPPLEFKSGNPTTLSLQLVFDTYELGVDVRKEYTDAIWNLMRVDDKLKDKNNKGRPPRVRFQWGKSSNSRTWAFEAVITKIQQKFTLFLGDGTPVRAVLDVTFQQVTDESLLPPQNPTSGGLEGLRLWTVQEGDTLAWIAHKEYGDPNEWRRIADRNRLTEVRALRPGMTLELPGG